MQKGVNEMTEGPPSSRTRRLRTSKALLALAGASLSALGGATIATQLDQLPIQTINRLPKPMAKRLWARNVERVHDQLEAAYDEFMPEYQELLYHHEPSIGLLRAIQQRHEKVVGPLTALHEERLRMAANALGEVSPELLRRGVESQLRIRQLRIMSDGLRIGLEGHEELSKPAVRRELDEWLGAQWAGLKKTLQERKDAEGILYYSYHSWRLVPSNLGESLSLHDTGPLFDLHKAWTGRTVEGEAPPVGFYRVFRRPIEKTGGALTDTLSNLAPVLDIELTPKGLRAHYNAFGKRTLIGEYNPEKHRE